MILAKAGQEIISPRASAAFAASVDASQTAALALAATAPKSGRRRSCAPSVKNALNIAKLMKRGGARAPGRNVIQIDHYLKARAALRVH